MDDDLLARGGDMAGVRLSPGHSSFVLRDVALPIFAEQKTFQCWFK